MTIDGGRRGSDTTVRINTQKSEKTLTARKVHARFTKFHAPVGPEDHIAEGAYHQLAAMR